MAQALDEGAGTYRSCDLGPVRCPKFLRGRTDLLFLIGWVELVDVSSEAPAHSALRCLPVKRGLPRWLSGKGSGPPADARDRGSSLGREDACGVCARSCPALCDPRDCSPPGSFAHGIFQTGILDWVAISSSGVFLTRG